MKKMVTLYVSLMTGTLLLLLWGCGGNPLLKDARTALESKQYELARTRCREAIAADSSNAEAWVLLSSSYRQSDSLRQALWTMEAARKIGLNQPVINSECTTIYRAMGDAAYQEDRPRVAINWYGKAQELAPNDSSLSSVLAHINLQQGYLDKAREQYELLLKQGADTAFVNPRLRQIDAQFGSADSHAAAAEKAYKNGHFKTAAKHAKKALDLQSDHETALYFKYMIEGREAYEAGKHAYKKGAVKKLWEAIELLGKAALYNDTAVEPHYYMGLSYEKKDKKEYGNAIEAFEKAHAMGPDTALGKQALKKARELKAKKEKMDKFWGKTHR